MRKIQRNVSGEAMTTTKQNFISGLREAPDKDLRLIFADFLEERGELPGTQFLLRGNWDIEIFKGKVRPKFTITESNKTYNTCNFYKNEQLLCVTYYNRIEIFASPKEWRFLNLDGVYRQAVRKAVGVFIKEFQECLPSSTSFWFAGFYCSKLLNSNLWQIREWAGVPYKDFLTYDEMLEFIVRKSFS